MKTTFIVFILKLVLIFLIMLVLNGCNNSDTNEPRNQNVYNQTLTVESNISENSNIFEKETNTIDSISINIINVDSESAKIIIVNNSSTTIIGDNIFKIQVLKDDNWYELPYVVEDDNFGFLGHGITIESSHTLECDIEWKSYYGVLERGHYRIINNFNTLDKNDKYLNLFYLSAEFDVE